MRGHPLISKHKMDDKAHGCKSKFSPAVVQPNLLLLREGVVDVSDHKRRLAHSSWEGGKLRGSAVTTSKPMNIRHKSAQL